MPRTRSTSPGAAKAASQTLKNSSAADASKTAAGSALTQAKSAEVTSARAATAASRVLREGRAGAAAKSAAGSALSQRRKD